MRQESRAEIPQENHAPTCSICHPRYPQAAIVWSRPERHGSRRTARNQSQGKHSGRQLAPALSKARARNGPSPAFAKPAEVRIRSRLNSKPLRSGSRLFETESFQAQPRRRSRRVARSLRELKGNGAPQTETSSNWYDTTPIGATNARGSHRDGDDLSPPPAVPTIQTRPFHGTNSFSDMRIRMSMT